MNPAPLALPVQYRTVIKHDRGLHEKGTNFREILYNGAWYPAGSFLVVDAVAQQSLSLLACHTQRTEPRNRPINSPSRLCQLRPTASVNSSRYVM